MASHPSSENLKPYCGLLLRRSRLVRKRTSGIGSPAVPCHPGTPTRHNSLWPSAYLAAKLDDDSRLRMLLAADQILVPTSVSSEKTEITWLTVVKGTS